MEKRAYVEARIKAKLKRLDATGLAAVLAYVGRVVGDGLANDGVNKVLKPRKLGSRKSA